MNGCPVSATTLCHVFPYVTRNLDLSEHVLTECPQDNNGHGSCKNPRRSQGWGHDATPFFAPCHRDYGGAYTFPADNGANSLNGDRCIDGYAFCCIGNLCSGYDDLDR